MTLASTFNLPLESEGLGSQLAQSLPSLVGPSSLPTRDLSKSAWSLGKPLSPGSPKEAQPSHPVSVYEACE